MSLKGSILTLNALPDWFFYQEKADGVELTSHQTAYFEPQEFIQGHEKHWWQESKQQLKPKDIVLRCRFDIIPDYILREFFIVLQKLMDFGFAIYICNYEENKLKLRRLTNESQWRVLNALYSTESIGLREQKLIEKFLIERSQSTPPRTRDQILFIKDLTAFITFFDNKYISEEALQIDRPIQLINQKISDANCMNSKDKIVQLNLSNFEDFQVELSKEHWEQALGVKSSLRKLALDSVVLDFNLILSIASQDDETPFVSLEELTLNNCDLSWDILLYFLSIMPQLKTLTLTECNIDGKLSVEDLADKISKLEALTITNDEYIDDPNSLPSEFIEKLLSECANLHSLYLTGIKFEKLSEIFNPTYEHVELKKLRNLELNYVIFENDIFFRLIAAAPNLVSLKVEQCVIPEKLNESYTFSLKKLKTFNVNISNVNSKIGEMLSECNNLNVIEISEKNVSLESLVAYLQKKPKSNIRLILRKYHITSELFENLLGIARFDSLTFINCNSEEFILNQDTHSVFNKIRRFKISNCRISESMQTLFLASMPTLKNLDIENDKYRAFIHSELFRIISLYLPQLRNLDLIGKAAAISSAFLQDPDCSLAQLRKISISSYDVAESLIYAILQKAKNIDKFEISDSLFSTIEKNTCFKDYLSIFQRNDNENEIEENDEKHDSLSDHEELDANTTRDPNKSYLLSRIFFAKEESSHPHPALYRLEAFGKIKVKQHVLQDQESPFLLYRVKPSLIDCLQPTWCDSAEEIKHFAWNTASINGEFGTKFYAMPDEMLLSIDWQNLSSMSLQERITHIYIEKLQPQDIEIKYDEENLFYMIRLTNEPKNQFIKSQLHYVVDYPLECAIPTYLLPYINYFTERGEGPLEFGDNTELTGIDYLKALIQQPVGSCAHRSFACKAILDQDSISSQIIYNKCHSRIEIKTENGAHTIDLGGFETDEVLVEKNLSGIEEKPKNKIVNEKDVNPNFVTWQQAKGVCHDPLLQIGKKVLLNVPSSDIENYILTLQVNCNKVNRPFYYADEPDDLICSARWIYRNENNIGECKDGPGGRCHDFLLREKGKNPVLIINYNHFKPEDIIRFNTLLDDFSKVDGTPTPDDLTVIGIHDPNRMDAYNGGDFYSRWDIKSTIILPIDSNASFELLTQIKLHDGSPCYEIDLFCSVYWKERLLGKWMLEGKALSFQRGELQKALLEHKTIHIKNGPWQIASFDMFWKNLLNNRRFEIANETIYLPKECQFTTSKGYDWESLNAHKVLDFTDSQEDIVYILNPSTFGSFLGTYEFKEQEKLLFSKKGWIAANQGKSIKVQLTRNINDDQLAELLTTCKTYQVTMELRSSCIELNNNVELIVTNDIDACLEEDVLQFDISECHPGDILSKLSACWQGLSFKFDVIISDVWQALNEGQDIILKGNISTELLDSLLPLLIPQGYLAPPLSRHNHFGKLTLMTQSRDIFASMPHRTIEVDGAMKLLKLNQEFGKSVISLLQSREPELINKLPLVKLRAIANALVINPECSLESPWEGLIELSTSRAKLFDLSDLSLTTATQLNNARLQQFEGLLKQVPFINIVGQTGVGKTSFIESLEPTLYKIFYGKQAISEWATDSFELIKIWFGDEATLEDSDLTMFEGMTKVRPMILVKGKIIELTATHKMVTAFNPVNDGGGRRLPSLIERHGNTLIFEPLHPAQLYHGEIKSILENTFNEETARTIGEIFLEVYKHINNRYSDQEVIISARELKMMALMIVADPIELVYKNALEKAFLIGKSVLLEKQKSEFEHWFTQRYPKFSVKKYDAYSFSVLDYYVTPSRFEHYELLTLLLKVQTFQRDSAKSYSECYGGLNMIVSEGEPGDGKSFSAVQILQYLGFVEGDKNTHYDEHEKIYYFIPASMNFHEKKILLLKAYNEGAIVIMDEINCHSMMEKLINDLLSGKYEGKLPLRPGFKIIATQNPIYYAGRRATSVAMKRRGLQCHFIPYPFEEIVGILIFKGMGVNDAIEIATDFEDARDYAIKHYLKPLPNFRDLEKVVKQYRTMAKEQGLEDNILQDLLNTNAENEEFSALLANILSFNPNHKRGIKEKNEKEKETENDVSSTLKRRFI